MKTAKQVIAEHLGMDIDDVNGYKYQTGGFTTTVFAIGDFYYCAAKNFSKAAKPKKAETPDFDWVEIPDSWVNRYGWRVYRANATKD